MSETPQTMYSFDVLCSMLNNIDLLLLESRTLVLFRLFNGVGNFLHITYVLSLSITILDRNVYVQLNYKMLLDRFRRAR